MILQHFGELASRTQDLNYAHDEERAPEDQEAADQHRHRPQGLDVAPVAPQLLVMMLVVLMASVVGRPGAGLPGDLLLVAAGDLQDVQVDVDEHREHGEEAGAEQHDHAHLLDDGEEGAEAVVVVGLQLTHHD